MRLRARSALTEATEEAGAGRDREGPPVTLINKTLASHQKASPVRPASHDNVAKTLVDSYYQ
jgi:hypothetical protein